MAWRRPGDKPLSDPMMTRLPTHICVTRPQWVNYTGSCSAGPLESCWRQKNAKKMFNDKVINSLWTGSRGPFIQQFFARNPSLMEISPCCNSFDGHKITINFCTCHDSTAVAPRTKFCSNHCIRIKVSVKRNFHQIWLAMENTFVKRGPGGIAMWDTHPKSLSLVHVKDPYHKSQNASVAYPTMHYFVTEMCTHVHISVTKCCIVGYATDAFWDLWDGSIFWLPPGVKPVPETARTKFY